MKIENFSGNIKIKLHPEVAKYFKQRTSRLYELFKKEIDIIPTDDVKMEDYNIILEQ